jgi:hypothetical protein
MPEVKRQLNLTALSSDSTSNRRNQSKKEEGDEKRSKSKKEVETQITDSFNSRSEPDYQIFILLRWTIW